MFIIHLGSSGFPFGNAQTQRIRLTFKALKLAGSNPLIINKHSLHQIENTKKIDRYQGIPYISTSLKRSRSEGFFSRNLNKFSGYLGEIKLLTKKRKSIHTAIYYDSSFLDLVYYRIVSKILGFRLVIQYVELRSAIQNKKNYFTRLSDILFDNYCFHFCDGIIVISEFLKNRSLKKKKSLPLIKIPAICDFDEFDISTKVLHENCLMFCGTIQYLEVIEFVLKVFVQLRDEKLYLGNLFLVIGGDLKKQGFKDLENEINKSGYKDCITLKKNVAYSELITIYHKAEMLIVPLRNTFQDIAGFHHKVGEYSATSRPIISTNLGEIQHYFKDGYSAILAEEFKVSSYVEKLTQYLGSEETLNKIGREGNIVGQEKLNYKTYSNPLNHFLMDTIG